MYQRRKSRIELNHDVSSLESNRITNLIAVNRNANNRRVDQSHFDVRIIRLVGNFLARNLASPILDAFNNQRHFLLGQRLVAILAAIPDRTRIALNELAGNPNDGQLAGRARHFFGLTKRTLANSNHCWNVGDRTGIHITSSLMGAANTNDVKTALLVLPCNHRLDVFRTNVESENRIVVFDRTAKLFFLLLVNFI